jgi:hypothetical protein
MKNPTTLAAAFVASLFIGCASKRAVDSGYAQSSGELIYEKPAPRTSGGGAQEGTQRNAVGIWTGSNGEERITLKFGVNGSLILTNAAGAESGTWKGSRNSYRISVGEFTGEFILLDDSTASFTLGGSHLEMRRSGR